MAALSRQESAQTVRIFGISLPPFDFWKASYRIPIAILVMPLAIAGTSLLLLREVVILFVLLKFPLPAIEVISIASFFAYISIIPGWFGFLLWRDMKSGMESFGSSHPTDFLTRLRWINRTISFAFVLVLALILLSEVSPLKAEFSIFGTNSIQVVATLLSLYAWTLVFEILTIVVPISRTPHSLDLLTLSILSSLEDRRAPFIDDSIKYFNRILRRMGWNVRIRKDIRLSLYFFTQPAIRRTAGRRLLMAVDQGEPADFVDVVADIVQEPPYEIVEKLNQKSRLKPQVGQPQIVRLPDQRTLMWLTIAGLVLALIAALPVLVPGAVTLFKFFSH